MLALKYLLIVVAIALVVYAAGMLAFNVFPIFKRRSQASEGERPGFNAVHVRRAGLLVLAAILPLLIALSISVVPAGHAGVRVSELSGTLPGTLYPGVHGLVPLIEHIDVYDTREKLFTTGARSEIIAKGEAHKSEPLNVQAKEGLEVGLAITVRYRLDAQRLEYIHNNLPQPVDSELVPAVVATAWRELAPNYTVREVFASKREEVRRRAADAITRNLGKDGLVVLEVMLRDIQLPPEYAKGLEQLLLKEQENDRMVVETDIQQKQVRISELEAEGQKAQQVKQAEAQAQVRVLQAKGESDAMRYLLPLKQKQIEQSRLEAEARKEATLKNAEAEAESKVIDSKAEQQRRRLLADAEADRLRVTGVAEAGRMRNEGQILKKNPLLINKIVAERVIDKLQIMMVPADGKFFFANDVMRSFNVGHAVEGGDDPAEKQSH